VGHAATGAGFGE